MLKITIYRSYKEIRISLYSLIFDIFAEGHTEKEAFIESANANLKLKELILGYQRRDLYAILYDRLPEKTWEINLATTLNQPVDMKLLYEFLFSEENNLICEIVLAKTFYEKGVDLFIHINKTAGSTLNMLLRSESVETLSCQFNAITISGLYKNNNWKSLLISGHRPLSFYLSTLDLLQVRKIVTVIRDPIDIAISFFNYALTMDQTNDPNWGEYYSRIVLSWKVNGKTYQNWFETYLDSVFFKENVKNIFHKFFGVSGDLPENSRALFNNLLIVGAVLLKPQKVNEYFSNTDMHNQVMENQSIKFVTRNSLNFDTVLNLSTKLAPDVAFYTLLNNFSQWQNDGVLDFKQIKSEQRYIEENK